MLSLDKSIHICFQWFSQFSGPEPVDLRGTSKSLWIYRSAKDFLNIEYCLTYRTPQFSQTTKDCDPLQPTLSTTVWAEKVAGKPQ